jgi:hypothetical protein
MVIPQRRPSSHYLPTEPTIVDLASHPELVHLVAVTTADLAEVSCRPSSMFHCSASNDAFSSLPAGILDALLKSSSISNIHQCLAKKLTCLMVSCFLQTVGRLEATMVNGEILLLV